MIINALCLANDRVYSSGWDGKVVRWNLPGGVKDAEFLCDAYVNVMTFAENTNTLIVGGRDGLMEKIRF